jgi:hypothetical protein
VRYCVFNAANFGVGGRIKGRRTERKPHGWDFNERCEKLLTPSVFWWSEFLVTDPEVPGTIPCATKFSE